MMPNSARTMATTPVGTEVRMAVQPWVVSVVEELSGPDCREFKPPATIVMVFRMPVYC